MPQVIAALANTLVAGLEEILGQNHPATLLPDAWFTEIVKQEMCHCELANLK